MPLHEHLWKRVNMGSDGWGASSPPELTLEVKVADERRGASDAVKGSAGIAAAGIGSCRSRSCQVERRTEAAIQPGGEGKANPPSRL